MTNIVKNHIVKILYNYLLMSMIFPKDNKRGDKMIFERKYEKFEPGTEL